MAKFNTNMWDVDFVQEIQFANMRAAVHDEMHDVLENEFVPFLIREIEANGLIGTGPDRGEGPPLSSRRAWQVESRGNMNFIVKTHPLVSERAFYLEYGTAATIHIDDTEGTSETFKFESTVGPTAGQIIYPRVIRGVQEYSFFRDAANKFDASGRLSDRAADEIMDWVERMIVMEA